MRSYLIDEIIKSDLEKITDFLKENAVKSNVDQVFWLKIPHDLLNETQFQHSDCQPYAIAVELGPNWMRLEFLVRSLSNMRCTCPDYCTKQQRNYVINFAHKMIQKLGIKT